MFASKNPFLFVLQVLAVIFLVLGSVFAAVELREPLLVLCAVLALQFLPEVPVLPPPGYQSSQKGDDDDDPGYGGSGNKVGFT